MPPQLSLGQDVALHWAPTAHHSLLIPAVTNAVPCYALPIEGWEGQGAQYWARAMTVPVFPQGQYSGSQYSHIRYSRIRCLPSSHSTQCLPPAEKKELSAGQGWGRQKGSSPLFSQHLYPVAGSHYITEDQILPTLHCPWDTVGTLHPHCPSSKDHLSPAALSSTHSCC